MSKQRRRSNSSSTAPGHSALKTKFETVEHEPVFEEELHGPVYEDGADLEKESTNSSAGSHASIAEEDVAAFDEK